MKAPPAVDVVVAARNEARDLGACLQSLGRQQYGGRLQVIVVDHRSQDETGRLARELGAQVLECGGCLGAARNRGWRAGTSGLVAFVDAHCELEPDWLAALVRRRQETAAGAVEGELVHRFTQAPVQPGAGAVSFYPWVRTGNCLYLRQALERVGGFAEGLWSCEDVDLSWRVLLAGFPLAYAPLARAIHWDRGSAWSHRRRFFRHGLGAGQLARRFGLKIAARPGWTAGAENWLYWLGALLGRRGPAPALQAVAAQPAVWAEGRQPGERVLWWYDREGVVVLARGEQRCRLEGVGSLFWRGLSLGWTRQQLVERVSRACGCGPQQVGRDVEQWSGWLGAEGWLTVRPENKIRPG